MIFCHGSPEIVRDPLRSTFCELGPKEKLRMELIRFGCDPDEENEWGLSPCLSRKNAPDDTALNRKNNKTSIMKDDQMAGKTKKSSSEFAVEKLPENWETLSIEQKYNIVNGKLHRLAHVDCDFAFDAVNDKFFRWKKECCDKDEERSCLDDDSRKDDRSDITIDVKLGSFDGSGRWMYAYIEWSDFPGFWENGADYRPCQFVRKKPVERGKFRLKDLPQELRAEFKVEDWEDGLNIPNIFDSQVKGEGWSECLERLFFRLELLKLGYDLCWECDEYRRRHQFFFEDYLRESNELPIVRYKRKVRFVPDAPEAPGSIEERIEAVKRLFLLFDLEVEIRIVSGTETGDDGTRDKHYGCEVFYEDDDWHDHDVVFVADGNTEKIDGTLDSSCISGNAADLPGALDDLYNQCVDAIRRNYHVEVWTE